MKKEARAGLGWRPHITLNTEADWSELLLCTPGSNLGTKKAKLAQAFLIFLKFLVANAEILP
jgi:hypothetical protein